MSLTAFFGLLGGIVVLAFLANRLAGWTRVPDVIVLMVAGMLLGPVFHLLDPSKFESAAHGFGALALILILFEAGLDLEFRKTLRHFPGGVLLALLSYGLSLVAIAIFLMAAIHLSRVDAFLVGAAFACVSSSVMLPVLQQMNLGTALKTTLVVEGALSDALGVLGVGAILDFGSTSHSGNQANVTTLVMRHAVAQGTSSSLAGGVVGSFLLRIVISLALALVVGFLWSRLLPLISEERFWQVLTFAAVLLVYSISDWMGGSSLFAVIAFGATLANIPGNTKSEFEFNWWVASKSGSTHRQLLVFHSELAFLVRTFFFVLLGLIVKFSGLRAAALPAVGIVAVIFCARWLSAQCSRLAMRDVKSMDIETISLLVPRGLITAVLAFEIVDARGSEFNFLPGLAFSVILLSNILMLVATFRQGGSSPDTSASDVSAMESPTPVTEPAS
jgi:cell volume regulation protein A